MLSRVLLQYKPTSKSHGNSSDHVTTKITPLFFSKTDFKTDLEYYSKQVMNTLTIEPTRVTPYVQMDIDKGIIEFKGRSSPEASLDFFLPILDNIKNEFSSNCDSIQANFAFEYFNTSSSKCLFDILKNLAKMEREGKDVEINWFYEGWDDDMKESGEDYEDVLGVKFNYIIID